MKVCITGFDVWSSLGRGPSVFLDGLKKTTRYLRKIENMPVEDQWIRCKTGMQIRVPLGDLAGPKTSPYSITRSNWPLALAEETAASAWLDAGIPFGFYSPRKIAIFNGTSHGVDNGILQYLEEKAQNQGSEMEWFGTFSTYILAKIADRIGASGPSMSVNTACSSSINSIGIASRLIRSGVIDCAVAGGSDVFSFTSLAGFNALNALDPEGCRPFDRNRSGTSLGDAAAFCVLESEVGARMRHAKVRAFIGGYSCIGEGYHSTSPDPTAKGATEVMKSAALFGGHQGDLSNVFAHGTGTRINDDVEVQAIENLLMSLNLKSTVSVTSIKGQIGHTLGSAGAMQVVAACIAIDNQFSPANFGLTNEITHTEMIRFPRQAFHSPISTVLCNGFGFGGNMASLAIHRPA